MTNIQPLDIIGVPEDMKRYDEYPHQHEGIAIERVNDSGNELFYFLPRKKVFAAHQIDEFMKSLKNAISLYEALSDIERDIFHVHNGRSVEDILTELRQQLIVYQLSVIEPNGGVTNT